MNILRQLSSAAVHTVALFRTVRTAIFSRRMVLFCSEHIGKQYLFKNHFNGTQNLSMVD